MEKQKTFIFPLLIREDYYSIVSTNTSIKTQSIVMSYLTPEEEKKLDTGETINIIRGNCRFVINQSDVIAYGEIDFSNDSDDLNYFIDLNWFNDKKLVGFSIPSQYDYENHTTISDRKLIKYYDTKRPEAVVQYVHSVLNKPKISVIFKHCS